MSAARILVVSSAAVVAALFTDLAYQFGRHELDVDSVDLPVAEDTPDSDTALESDTDTRE